MPSLKEGKKITLISSKTASEETVNKAYSIDFFLYIYLPHNLPPLEA
jgi:hypothetical protein